MKRSPHRQDWEYFIVRGKGRFSPAAYACILTTRDRDNKRCVHHLELFYGRDGRDVRAQAVRYGKRMLAGGGFAGPRDVHLPSNYPMPDELK